MAPPVGNQFWKLRSRHGRDALFATPDLLWEAAQEYFEWVDANPWVKVEQMKRPTVTKDKVGDMEISTVHSLAELPNARPYTLSGLCLYLQCDESYFRKFKEQRSDRQDFITVITRIEQIVATQQFEGAVVGAFNPNIISRSLGLADKVATVSEVTVTVKRQRKERPDHG